jgi:putative phosphoserine phosphatase/1-acylglycerol-3-phosphate O-acyltransferase
VFIDRENAASAIEAMQPLVDAMRNERKSVVIAPEGTRTISPKLAPFKKGAFHLAIQAGVPVVPIVIHNAGDVAPKGDFVFRPATVEVDVLPPVDTGDWRAETIEAHVAEIRRLFQAKLGQEQKQAALPVAAEPEKPVADTPSADKAPVRRALRKKKPGKKTPRTVSPTARAPDTIAAREPAGGPEPVAGRTVLKKKALKKKALKKKVKKTRAATPKQPRKPPRKKPLRKKVLSKKPLTGDSSA